MIKHHYQELLADDPGWAPRAAALAAKTWELTSYLVDVLDVSPPPTQWQGIATYHDSCHGLREEGIQAQPRRLLAAVDGLELREMDAADACCGFGGTFCVKYPDISLRMARDKARSIDESGAKLVLAGDLACLMHLAGYLKRQGSKVQARHVAEALTDRWDAPAIGEPDP